MADRDWELRKRLVRVRDGLAAERSSFDPHYAELARLFQPRLGRHLQSGVNSRSSGNTSADSRKGGEAINNKLLSSAGTFASEVFANGLDSGMSSASTPWFTLTTADPGMREFKPVKEWLDEVKRRIYIAIAKTGWYGGSKEGYLETGVFGTEAAFLSEHWDHFCVPSQLTVGEYLIRMGEDNRVEALYRRCDMTDLMLAEKFGQDVLPKRIVEKLNRSEYGTNREVWHAIEPNVDYQPGKIGQRNKRWLSAYWLADAAENLDKAFLRVSGYSDKPFYACRADVSSGETYGRSRGMIAAAEIRQLQVQTLRKAQGIDLLLRPPVYGPMSLASTQVRLAPGGITALAGIGNPELKAVYQVDPRVISELREDIRGTEGVVDKCFYVNLFQAISSMAGVQPRNMLELQRRYEEQMQQLGPVVNRINTEKLEPVVDRYFMLLLRAGWLPPPPPELEGERIEIQFTSTMTEMQRSSGLQKIEAVASFTGSLIAAFPEAGDKLNVDQAIDEYADLIGGPASLIRSDDEVKAIRDGRAQQQQQQQMADMAPSMAKGAEAAQILANTRNDAGEPLLGAVLGNA